jgi:hypothetical protein
MMPANVLGRMRATKALFSHPETPPHEAAAARAMYEKLVAKYGNPDASTRDNLNGIPIWKPSNGWKAEVLSRQAGVAKDAYQYLYKRSDVVLVPACTLDGAAAKGWFVCDLMKAGAPPKVHLDDAGLISFAISKGFECYIADEANDFRDFEERAQCARDWHDAHVNNQRRSA